MYQKVIGCSPENWETITRIANEHEANGFIKKIDTWDWDKISHNSNATMVVNDHNHVIYKKTNQSPTVGDLETVCKQLYNVSQYLNKF